MSKHTPIPPKPPAEGGSPREITFQPVPVRYRHDGWTVELSAAERSKDGVARPIFYKGEQVGEWRHHDERLTMFLLRFRRRHRFGPEADELPRAPTNIPGIDPDERIPFDPEGELDGCLDGLEFAPDPPPESAEDEDPSEAGPDQP